MPQGEYEKEETEYILTEQEIYDLFQESMKKYKNVVGSCNPIYQHLVDKLDLSDEEKRFMEATASRITHAKKNQRDRVLNNELERVGFQIADPYYIACMKPISPLIYKAFYVSGQTSDDVKQRFNINAINEGFEQLGGNAHYRFKRKFYAEGRNYYKRLKAKGILGKYPKKSVPDGEPSSKYLPSSWIQDYLDKMRVAGRKDNYTHLIQVK